MTNVTINERDDAAVIESARLAHYASGTCVHVQGVGWTMDVHLETRKNPIAALRAYADEEEQRALRLLRRVERMRAAAEALA